MLKSFNGFRLLNKDIISSEIPLLGPTDTVAHALELMETYHLPQLPLVDREKYIGLAFEEELLNRQLTEELGQSPDHFPKIAAPSHLHCLEAVQLANDFKLNLVPFVDKEDAFIGAATVSDLLQALGKIMGVRDAGAVIVLEMEQRTFSFSEISRIIESNDAQIAQLNTYWEPQSERLIVTIKINKFEVSDIINSFQRYEYPVKYYFGEELYENELRSNYEHLMNYLNI